MDQLESLMAEEDDKVRATLTGLRALLGPGRNAALKTADSSYARFSEIQNEILHLSRQNTNVRSLVISLNEKRTAVSMCDDALNALEKAIREEPVNDRTPELPR